MKRSVRLHKEFFNLYVSLRSQAIYGSLVETIGPYSQNYTSNFIHTVLNSFHILTTTNSIVNMKNEH